MSKPAAKINAAPAPLAPPMPSTPSVAEISPSTEKAAPAATPPTDAGTSDTATAPALDPHAGMGGRYRVANGVRCLVDRTAQARIDGNQES